MIPISVKDLTVNFKKRTILDHLSIDLFAGEIVGLIGPSGAGKSTFINTLLGMEKMNKGSVTILGQKIPNRKVLAQIGFMAQSDALFDELTGRQNLEFFAALQGIDEELFDEKLLTAAKIVNLADELDNVVGSYSGGMKRRLSLAIALQTDAPLLLLDEPTVGIDPELRQEIWKDLRQQAKQNKGILITTHVMDEAEKCDKVLFLREGRFVAKGSPSELKEQFGVQTMEEAFVKAGQNLAESHLKTSSA